jgi:hypothetical protein
VGPTGQPYTGSGAFDPGRGELGRHADSVQALISFFILLLFLFSLYRFQNMIFKFKFVTGIKCIIKVIS